MTKTKRPRRGATNPAWLVVRREAAGRRLAERRIDMGIKTQHDLAEKTGLTTMTIGRIERGLSGSEWSYRKITDALGLRPDFFTRPDETPVATELGTGATALQKTLAFFALFDEVGPMLTRLVQRLLASAAEDPDHAEAIAAEILADLPPSRATPSESDQA
jgi:transcriptional regulator with XRE-family HTH domain